MNTISLANPGFPTILPGARAAGFASTSEGRRARQALAAFASHRPGMLDRLRGGRKWVIQPGITIGEALKQRTSRWEIAFDDPALEHAFGAIGATLAAPIEIEPGDFETLDDGHTHIPMDIVKAPAGNMDCRKLLASALWTSMTRVWRVRAKPE